MLQLYRLEEKFEKIFNNTLLEIVVRSLKFQNIYFIKSLRENTGIR